METILIHKGEESHSLPSILLPIQIDLEVGGVEINNGRVLSVCGMGSRRWYWYVRQRRRELIQYAPCLDKETSKKVGWVYGVIFS